MDQPIVPLTPSTNPHAEDPNPRAKELKESKKIATLEAKVKRLEDINAN